MPTARVMFGSRGDTLGAGEPVPPCPVEEAHPGCAAATGLFGLPYRTHLNSVVPARRSARVVRSSGDQWHYSAAAPRRSVRPGPPAALVSVHVAEEENVYLVRLVLLDRWPRFASTDAGSYGRRASRAYQRR